MEKNDSKLASVRLCKYFIILTMENKLELLSLESRVSESKRMMLNYPNQIPVILEGENIVGNKLKCERFLVPKRFKFQEFVHNLRKNMNMDPNAALFISINGDVPGLDRLMISIYEEHKSNDGFLYIRYSPEVVLG